MLGQGNPVGGVSRRSLLRAAAWSSPAVALATAAPARAASYDRRLRIIGPWRITPYPGSLDYFSLDFNGGSTTFDVSGVFGSDDPADVWSPNGGFQLYWQANSSSNLIPPHPAFIGGMNTDSVTVDNTGWGFGSSCSIRVMAIPLDDRPLIDTWIHFFVGDGGFS